MPYDKPPLSKQFLAGSWSADRIRLRRPEAYQKHGIQLRLGHAATSVDVDRKVVRFEDDAETYDALVVATGLAPRRLPAQDHLDGLYSLRSLADGQLLRAALLTREPLVIVGGGFIGLEVAASATKMGVPVTVVEPLSAPLAGPLGVPVGTRVQRLHEEHGVRVITGVGVSRALGTQALEALELTDGRRIEARHAVVGIGSVPNTGWLSDSGVKVDNGVLCDQDCRAYGAESIYVAGDVARTLQRGDGSYLRVEHWTNAVEQAEIAARAVLNTPSAGLPEPVPYFWSDQFGVKLQFVGSARGARSVVTAVDDADSERQRSLTIFAIGDRATGALAWNWPTAAGRVKKLLRGPVTVETIVEQLNTGSAAVSAHWADDGPRQSGDARTAGL
ncbi:MAG: hypothetical protein JWQ95_6612 [Sphaerisporangium sp.]|nr:hypothetical protein [Sphaerisporangium sp.]